MLKFPYNGKTGSYKGRWLSFPGEVRSMETWKNLQKVSQLMSVFQALTLMLMFGTFVLTLLDYIKKHHK